MQWCAAVTVLVSLSASRIFQGFCLWMLHFAAGLFSRICDATCRGFCAFFMQKNTSNGESASTGFFYYTPTSEETYVVTFPDYCNYIWCTWIKERTHIVMMAYDAIWGNFVSLIFFIILLKFLQNSKILKCLVQVWLHFAPSPFY